jgi:Phytanoyl-CoA dioxygenase (PhyH)
MRSILPGIPLVESPFFDEIAPSCKFDLETARIAKELNENGFALLRFPDDKFDARAERIKRNLAPHFDFERWRTHGWRNNEGMRLQHAWRFDEDVRAIAVNPKILKILADLYGRKPWPFTTLNFPVGTQQHFHSDCVHFSSIPERIMCGVWVALEDVSDGAGPLEYYPGSHKWPIIYNDKIGVRVTGSDRHTSQELYHDLWEALVEKKGIAPQYFCPRKGEALIWAANLLHGGSRQRDPTVTRWSQVTHYYFENCCYIKPMHSDPLIGKLCIRELINIETGKKATNVYVDAKLSDLDLSYRMSLLLDPYRPLARPFVRGFRHLIKTVRR